jgi:CheY-like chemotaxis protein
MCSRMGEGNMHSIMIVENEKKWRKLLAEGLMAKGYQVRAVQGWEEAEDQLKGNGHFDVIVLNLHLLMKTDFLAQKVLESVVRYCPCTPCIILSGYPNELIKNVGRYGDQVFELLWKGGDPQEFNLNLLCHTIERAIREKLEEVSIVLDRSVDEFTQAAQDDFIYKLSEIVNVDLGRIHPRQQVESLGEAGHVLVTLEMSAEAARRLVTMYLAGESVLRELGIAKVGPQEITNQHLRSLEARLTQHRSNLDKLLEQKAIYAAGEEPLSLLNQIEAEERAIAKLEACLAELGDSD